MRDLYASVRHRGALVGLGFLAVAVTSCSSAPGETSVALAQARVSAKEAELAAATTAANQTYITALDRYGDVLNATAPTVGDVKSAGQDLSAPRQTTVDAADAAVKAHQQVSVAEQELAAAKTSLQVAQSQAAGTAPVTTPTPTTTTTTTAPLVPAATTNRVKQADAEFQAAMAGVTPETPLVEAAQRFNAAVVALEMSWLALFADAGCLSDSQQQQAQAAVHDYTAALQSALAEAGYFQGEVDGVYGPSTVEAVEAVQKKHGLPVTGAVDKATAAALQADLQAKGGAAALVGVASTAAVQQTLKLAGFWDAPVDGTWTPALTDALKAFQTKLGVPASGTVDAETITALEDAIAKAAAAKTSTTAPATPTPSVTTVTVTASTSTT